MQWAKPKEHRDEQAHEQNTKKQTEGKQNPTREHNKASQVLSKKSFYVNIVLCTIRDLFSMQWAETREHQYQQTT